MVQDNLRRCVRTPECDGGWGRGLRLPPESGILAQISIAIHQETERQNAELERMVPPLSNSLPPHPTHTHTDYIHTCVCVCMNMYSCIYSQTHSHSLTHTHNQSHTYLPTQSLKHALTLACTLTLSLSLSLNHVYVCVDMYVCICSHAHTHTHTIHRTHLLTNSLTQSLTHTHACTLTHSLSQSITHSPSPSLTHSLTRSRIHHPLLKRMERKVTHVSTTHPPPFCWTGSGSVCLHPYSCIRVSVSVCDFVYSTARVQRNSMNESQSFLGQTMDRLQSVMRTATPKHFCYLVLFMLAVFFILYYMTFKM